MPIYIELRDSYVADIVGFIVWPDALPGKLCRAPDVNIEELRAALTSIEASLDHMLAGTNDGHRPEKRK